MKRKENCKLDWGNKEVVKKYYSDYNKVWYRNNKKRRAKTNKLYQQTHRKEEVLKTQRYVRKHPEKVKAYNRLFDQTTEGKYRLVLYRAKKWGAPYLTIEEYKELLSLPCAYCGEVDKLGIDRIDNSKGYTKENSAPACRPCNFMKKTMTVKEFLERIMKIAEYNK